MLIDLNKFYHQMKQEVIKTHKMDLLLSFAKENTHNTSFYRTFIKKRQSKPQMKVGLDVQKDYINIKNSNILMTYSSKIKCKS